MDNQISIVPIELATDKRLTKNQICVLIALFSFRAKNTDLVWPSRNAISQRCGLPETRISAITTELVALGWLEKAGRGGFSKATRYKITVPETVTEPVTVTESVTVTEPVTRGVTEPVTQTVTEPVTRKEQSIEQTNGTNHKWTDEDRSVAENMLVAIRRIAPSAKGSKSWPDTIRLMRERDGHTHAAIWSMFEWANNDDFWSANILSPDALRKQWTKLEAKRLQSSGRTKADKVQARRHDTISRFVERMGK